MAKYLKEAAASWIAVFVLAFVLIKAGPAFGIWPFSGGEESTREENAILNINTASQEAIAALPNVGEARAKAIIDYRQQNGPFKTVEGVKQVPGIEEQVFASIKDRITVGEEEEQSSLDESSTQNQARVVAE
jgi:comEA protein